MWNDIRHSHLAPFGLWCLGQAVRVHAGVCWARLATQPRAGVSAAQQLATALVARGPVAGGSTWQAAAPLVAAPPGAGLSTGCAWLLAWLPAARVAAGNWAGSRAGRALLAMVARRRAAVPARQVTLTGLPAAAVLQGEAGRQVWLELRQAACTAASCCRCFCCLLCCLGPMTPPLPPMLVRPCASTAAPCCCFCFCCLLICLGPSCCASTAAAAAAGCSSGSRLGAVAMGSSPQLLQQRQPPLLQLFGHHFVLACPTACCSTVALPVCLSLSCSAARCCCGHPCLQGL